ncbi:hypothetical protein ACS8FD_12680 [Psychrobacter sp. 1U2]|uniref:hypothetical protein n=1 Tax=Psychrobacter sp. 1U2 TaxID=3453577 RepID=UPI003F44BE29
MNIVSSTLLKTALSASLLLSLPVMAAAAQKWQLDVPKTKVDFEVAYLGSGTIIPINITGQLIAAN